MSDRDNHNRRRALTELEATLLVEAAAGTGKTSLLAGRVLFLLAAGVPPRDIAAITFTEFAAGELRECVTYYLEELLAGRVPLELRLAFPRGVEELRRSALEQARARMDEFTCTTIHGFCHDLLRIRDAVKQQFPGNVIHVASNFRSTDEILRHINRCFEAPLGAQETGYVALESTRQDAGHGLPA